MPRRSRLAPSRLPWPRLWPPGTHPPRVVPRLPTCRRSQRLRNLTGQPKRTSRQPRNRCLALLPSSLPTRPASRAWMPTLSLRQKSTPQPFQRPPAPGASPSLTRSSGNVLAILDESSPRASHLRAAAPTTRPEAQLVKAKPAAHRTSNTPNTDIHRVTSAKGRIVSRQGLGKREDHRYKEETEKQKASLRVFGRRPLLNDDDRVRAGGNDGIFEKVSSSEA